MIALMI